MYVLVHVTVERNPADSSSERPNIKRNYKFLVLAFAVVKGRLKYAGREDGQAGIRGFIRYCG